VKNRAARRANPVLGSIRLNLAADPDTLVTLGTYRHHIGKINRHLPLYPTTLRILLRPADMLVMPIHAFNNNFAVFRKYTQHFAPNLARTLRSRLTSRLYFYYIAFDNSHLSAPCLSALSDLDQLLPVD
jgi:hypothetical protein